MRRVYKKKSNEEQIVIALISIAIVLAFFKLIVIALVIYVLNKIAKKQGVYKAIKKSWHRNRTGNIGEKKVQRVLKSIEKEHVVLNDLNLSNGDFSSQIDHIFISKDRIFNIETKNYSGIINIKDDKWTQETTKGLTIINDVSKQCRAHYLTLNRIFKNNYDINNLIVIANENTEILGANNSNVPIIKITELKKYIESFPTAARKYSIKDIEETILTFKDKKFSVYKKKLKYFWKNNWTTLIFTIISIYILAITYIKVPNNILKVILK